MAKLWVYNNTAGVWVWCVCLPGKGAVSFSPTYTIPVQNTRYGSLTPIILIITVIFAFYSLKQIQLHIHVIHFVREVWKYVSLLSETMSMTASTVWETTSRRTLPRVPLGGTARERQGKSRKQLGRRSDRNRTSEELGIEGNTGNLAGYSESQA